MSLDSKQEETMRTTSWLLAAIAAISLPLFAYAGEEENPEDFMQIHMIEITFHKAGSTKDLDLMMSLFADGAVLTAGGKTYSGKDEIRGFWKSAGTFQPQNQWVAYTPAFRIEYDVDGDHAHLYFECLYVDKPAQKIVIHTNSDDELVRINGHWLIKDMKAAVVPEL
jgi:hypothetical protein